MRPTKNLWTTNGPWPLVDIQCSAQWGYCGSTFQLYITTTKALKKQRENKDNTSVLICVSIQKLSPATQGSKILFANVSTCSNFRSLHTENEEQKHFKCRTRRSIETSHLVPSVEHKITPVNQRGSANSQQQQPCVTNSVVITETQ
jgi:hypothetical protein